MVVAKVHGFTRYKEGIMGYLDWPTVGDKVRTRSGFVGILVRFTGINDSVVVRDKDGNERVVCIQACKKID